MCEYYCVMPANPADWPSQPAGPWPNVEPAEWPAGPARPAGWAEEGPAPPNGQWPQYRAQWPSQTPALWLTLRIWSPANANYYLLLCVTAVGSRITEDYCEPAIVNPNMYNEDGRKRQWMNQYYCNEDRPIEYCVNQLNGQPILLKWLTERLYVWK